MSRMTYDQLQQILRKNAAITVEGLVKSTKAKPPTNDHTLDKYSNIPWDKINEYPPSSVVGFSITITGQIRGGKNNMIVTKKGKHVPKKEWAEWRDGAVADVSLQLPPSWEPISHPVNVHIDYVAGDRKRRDFPAICDAIWHVLERAGFVTDDTLLWPARSSRRYDKENPHAVITVIE